MKAFACANLFIKKNCPFFETAFLLVWQGPGRSGLPLPSASGVGPVSYSGRRLLTGLANAARRARKPTVRSVMAIASAAASAKIHQLMVMR